MKVLATIPETILDGEGIRYSIYLSGCNHHCEGCHNPDSWDPNNGYELTKDKLNNIIDEINNNSIIDGITLSGGDPFYNIIELGKLLRELKTKTKKNIWVYTGYTIEELVKNPIALVCLDFIDVLVDGPFIEMYKDPRLEFRGSSNQRIINVKQYLNEKNI